MDFLKIKTAFIMLIAASVFATHLTAQTSPAPGNELRSAFRESYKHEKNGKISKAIDALAKVYSGKSYEINARLGYLSNLNKQYNESIYYYKTAIELMPLSVEARLGLSNPVAAIEDWTTLEINYNDILKIDPNNSQANYNLGMMYYYRADYTGALKYIEKTANMYPFDYYSVLMLAWTNLKLGRSREAEVLFNKVLLISPDDKSAEEGLGLLGAKK